MKTLVVVSHPNIEESIVNKRWIEELKKYPELFTVHEIYKAYPTRIIDVAKEQALIEAHQCLVPQFPLYWFNCTPSLKKWLDDLFTYGWAYGSTGNKLVNKKVGLAVSAGIKCEDFSKEGRYLYTLEEILRPFEITMNYVKAAYQNLFVFYGAEYPENLVPASLNKSAIDYIHYLTKLSTLN